MSSSSEVVPVVAPARPTVSRKRGRVASSSSDTDDSWEQPVWKAAEPAAKRRNGRSALADEVRGESFFRPNMSRVEAERLVLARRAPFVVREGRLPTDPLRLTFARDGMPQRYLLRGREEDGRVTVEPLGTTFASVHDALRSLGLLTDHQPTPLRLALQSLAAAGASPSLLANVERRAAASGEDESWVITAVDMLHGMGEKLVGAVESHFGTD